MKTFFITLLLFTSSAFADYQWSAENPTYTQFQIQLAPDPRSSDAVSESVGAWTSTNTALETIYMITLYIDYKQTSVIANNKSLYYEKGYAKNFIGEYPNQTDVNQYFIASALLHLGVAYILPYGWRETYQSSTIAFNIKNIDNNLSLGIGYGF